MALNDIIIKVLFFAQKNLIRFFSLNRVFLRNLLLAPQRQTYFASIKQPLRDLMDHLDLGSLKGTELTLLQCASS